ILLLLTHKVIQIISVLGPNCQDLYFLVVSFSLKQLIFVVLDVPFLYFLRIYHNQKLAVWAEVVALKRMVQVVID
ncbi:MAG: hypothetical protein ACK559_38280, partial [bacterium]